MRRKPTVLIVDDAPEILHVMLSILRDEYVIAAATTGSKALELARNEPTPDLILLDIKMPNMDGYEVLQQLKSTPATAGIPVIFVTGLSDCEDEAKGLRLGAVDYISKPVNPELLRMRVRTQLELQRSRQSFASVNNNEIFNADKPPTLLVVDDVPESIHQLLEVLKDDFNVLVARSGAEALELVEGPNPPDLVLLDVVMPHMSGYEVCRRIKQNAKTRDIPIIFVTIQDDPSDEAEGLDIGAVDYITKPIIGTVVRARVRSHLALSRAMKSLQKAQAELFRAEKMAALHRLVVGIAHALNTPIGTAITTASAVQDSGRTLSRSFADGKLSKPTLEHYVTQSEIGLSIVLRSLGRAADLIDTFKQVSFDQSDERRRTFLLEDMVADVVDALGINQAPSDVSCRWAIVPDIELDSFPGALARVLISLIQNAKLHGYRNGPGIIHISASRGANGSVNIAVADQGQGIAPDHVGRIFDPFFSARLGGGGPGLGLAITHNLITNLLGGTIRVESTVGAGAHFLLNLPTVAPQAAAPT